MGHRGPWQTGEPTATRTKGTKVAAGPSSLLCLKGVCKAPLRVVGRGEARREGGVCCMHMYTRVCIHDTRAPRTSLESQRLLKVM